MRSRIMYIEDKSGGLDAVGRIGRVTFSKTGATRSYAGRTFQSLKGAGFKANFYDVATGEHFWICGAMARMGSTDASPKLLTWTPMSLTSTGATFAGRQSPPGADTTALA